MIQLITKKVFIFGNLPVDIQDYYLIDNPTRTFDNYYPYTISSYKCLEPNSLDGYLVLYGAEVGEEVLIHYIW